MTLSPCLECGEPTDGPRCPDHTIDRTDDKASARDRGYDTAWDRLSKRARRLQPWCTDCGATDDLQLDHLPQAWERKAAGLPIRLTDVEVCCGSCNRARGAARGPQTGGITPPAPPRTPPLEAKFENHTGVR